MQFVIALG